MVTFKMSSSSFSCDVITFYHAFCFLTSSRVRILFPYAHSTVFGLGLLPIPWRSLRVSWVPETLTPVIHCNSRCTQPELPKYLPWPFPLPYMLISFLDFPQQAFFAYSYQLLFRCWEILFFILKKKRLSSFIYLHVQSHWNLAFEGLDGNNYK